MTSLGSWDASNVLRFVVFVMYWEDEDGYISCGGQGLDYGVSVGSWVQRCGGILWCDIHCESLTIWLLMCWCLTHWGWVTHISVCKLTIIGSDNGLSPGWRQAIIWTNVGILLIGPLGTNFSEILIEIYTFSSKKMHLKMPSGKWRPFYFGLNVLSDLSCWISGEVVLS